MLHIYKVSVIYLSDVVCGLLGKFLVIIIFIDTMTQWVRWIFSQSCHFQSRVGQFELEKLDLGSVDQLELANVFFIVFERFEYFRVFWLLSGCFWIAFGVFLSIFECFWVFWRCLLVFWLFQGFLIAMGVYWVLWVFLSVLGDFDCSWA